MVRLASAVAVILIGMVAGLARAELVDRVAAVVNDDVITLSEVETRVAPELARVRAETDSNKRGELRRELTRKALDALIGEKLMEAQIKELGIEVAESELEPAVDEVMRQNNVTPEQFERMLSQEGFSMSAYRVYLRKHIARAKLVNLKVRSKVKISDEDLKAEYARVAREEALDFEVHARHILMQLDPKATPQQVETVRMKAAALGAEARKPGVDFAELAKKKSEGPSAADGGDLGFFKRGVMVGDFEKAAFTLPVGGISDPVRTRFGWHVVKVEERRAGAPRSFDEMKEQLREKMLRGQLEKYTEKYVQELRAAAVVDVKL